MELQVRLTYSYIFSNEIILGSLSSPNLASCGLHIFETILVIYQIN